MLDVVAGHRLMIQEDYLVGVDRFVGWAEHQLNLQNLFLVTDDELRNAAIDSYGSGRNATPYSFRTAREGLRALFQS